MPALPALLLSIYFAVLLLTMAPLSFSKANTLSAVRMAAILDDQSACGRGERLALALARENINSLMEGSSRARVEVDVYELQKDSQYDTTDTMCQILPKGVVSVIGPASSPASGSTISHICGEKEIPHVKIGPEETPKLPYLRFASVTLYPSNEDLSLAIGSILRSFGYPTASLVCAKAECLLRLEELVHRFLISRETLSVRMLDDSLDPTPLLKEIRDDKVATIIIDANASISYHILRKANELGMMSAFYKYILTTMDFPLLRLDDVVGDQSNILGFSMLNGTHPFFLEFIRSLNLSWKEGCDLSPYPGPALSSALMFDAVHVVVSAVRELNRSQEIGVKPLSCTSPLIWQHGTSLMNYLRMVEYDGLTGHIEFNSKGQRTNYTLKILEKHPGGHKEIGTWYSNNTLVMNSTSLDLNASETLANKTLIVTTILENPYLMRKPNYQNFQGNEQYEGFCVDMLREMADILKFSFKIKLVDDGLYGAPEPNGSWTGMVGELINRKADLAVAGFTITSEREKVIDFSKPFMTLGISILYRVHLGRKPGYFSFLDPFSPAVWLFMLLAYLAVSCVLFLAARLSPYEWYNPHPCLRERKDVLENQYTLGNSLWFPVGGFMQQGSEIMPRALSTRCVSGVWWMFTLIIISSYTANLAAFLTVQRMENPIESPDDLADQTNIQYGTIHGGSTMTFFMNSRYQTYQRMWNYMYSKQPSVFVKSTEEGIARVVNSKYAFLMESTMNEYYRSLNCNLTQIGGLLDTKGYGIGMPLGSPYRDEITLGILQLQESNRLEILKRRWWEGGQCPKEEDHRAKGLGMENIGGIFVVLICGLIIAVFVAIMEFLWSTRRSAETDEVNLHHHPPPPPPPLPLSSSSSCPAPGLNLSSNTSVSVCQEMLTEFRNAVSCKKSSRSRRRRPLSSAGGGVLRHPSRLALATPRPIRLVREMRLSNGKLYSGTGSLTGGLGGGGCPDLGPGPQRLLEDPLGVNATPPGPPPVSALVGPPAPLRSFLQGCSHVRICQECRRIQSLRPATLTPPPPPPPSSSSSASSCSRIPPPLVTPGHHLRHNPHHHMHYHHGSMSLPRLPPPPPPLSADRADSDGGGRTASPGQADTKPPPPPRPLPPPKTPTRPPTDLLVGHN
ncbi:glutamate receptor ionotropic, kainate 5-like isoform X1 [Sebastes umbrosus]|uniref:glutamate receptor ionotropic, kainate 5-like isoform X1 n=1 Tax=Sebastes umbrosus TaxID=72105 RepID=UPI00189F529A|nr:glutamate receptor ionotropic, kainate 5-like isoform X1 [Sebastes umbrosus]XP_037651603.1 glutamate receptor ionotropic, kainate 5-like isoform X1 [Sebastes umbrosus]XP_037651604.1 glutamate receptor ionotropic, kainate 5-like isoform X1 [Sebastes umbrosus]